MRRAAGAAYPVLSRKGRERMGHPRVWLLHAAVGGGMGVARGWAEVAIRAVAGPDLRGVDSSSLREASGSRGVGGGGLPVGVVAGLEERGSGGGGAAGGAALRFAARGGSHAECQ